MEARQITVAFVACLILLSQPSEGHAQPFFKLFCAGHRTTPPDGSIRVQTVGGRIHMTAPFVGFSRGFPSGSVSPLAGGQCTWEDRGFRESEQGIPLYSTVAEGRLNLAFRALGSEIVGSIPVARADSLTMFILRADARWMDGLIRFAFGAENRTFLVRQTTIDNPWRRPTCGSDGVRTTPETDCGLTVFTIGGTARDFEHGLRR
jgi:hypothetical protein